MHRATKSSSVNAQFPGFANFYGTYLTPSSSALSLDKTTEFLPVASEKGFNSGGLRFFITVPKFFGSSYLE